MKAVIMAGGKGTRIASVNREVPKPMIPVCGKPVLQYQIETLKKQGYKGAQIEEYFKFGESFGVHLQYIKEETPLGTAGGLYYLKGELQEDFLLLNGDILWDIDLGRFAKVHRDKGGLATVFAHPNSHPWDSGIILAESSGVVTKWYAKEEERGWLKNRVNAGLHMLSSKILEKLEKPEKLDLDRDVLKPLIPHRQLYVYDSPEYVKDMGTPARYEAVGMAERKNLTRRQRAIFLDRDGTLNKDVGFLRKIGEMELLPGVAEAVRLINESGFLAIVVTNQSVIARGEVSVEELEEIHRKLETLLGWEGAYLDDIFYCPHHPDRGFAGERPEYKIPCSCRKPAPGLLFQAAEKYHIALEESWMIGDRESDMEAGRRAGCRVACVGGLESVGTQTYGTLLECIRDILG